MSLLNQIGQLVGFQLLCFFHGNAGFVSRPLILVSFGYDLMVPRPGRPLFGSITCGSWKYGRDL